MSGDGSLEHRLASSMKLVHLTCALAAEQDLDRILRIVTDGVREALGSERGTLFLCDDATDELYTRTVTELEIQEIRIPRNRGVVGWVASNRRLANIPVAAEDDRWSPAADTRTGFTTRNVLAAPVVSNHDERLLGVLQVLNRRSGVYDDFDEQLLVAFAAHAGTALERARLVREAKASEELRILLEAGRRIQTGFLPQRTPKLPGYDVATWWEPAETLGGDYFDLLELPDGRLGVVIADVSGHGFGASLIMASARAMLHVLARTFSEPEAVMSLVSESMAGSLREGRFITMCTVALDPRNHALVYANAGHAPVLLYRSATGTFEELASTSLPLGFSDEHIVPTGLVRRIDPGDVLALSTDGVIETRGTNGELFGTERLKSVIHEAAGERPEVIVERIHRAIHDFQPAGNVDDDVTLVVVGREP